MGHNPASFMGKEALLLQICVITTFNFIFLAEG